MYHAVTHDISVTVETRFLDKESDPDQQNFVWAYHIRINNDSAETVQLLSRHWIITDGLGRVQEVRGEGVVGEQPRLEPGSSYAYTSGTPLNTPSGTMHGSYLMRRDDGSRFEITIPLFSLDSEFAPQVVH